MLEKIHIDRQDHTDLNMYQCGIEDCIKGHSWGPGVRDHYLIHYVLSGKGSFQFMGKTYCLEKGQGFLICPDMITYYEADSDDPWTYAWVGFKGLRAESYLKLAGLSAENPIFNYTRDNFIKECFEKMIATKDLVKSSEIRLLGLLYLFLSQLIEVAAPEHLPGKNENRKEAYIKRAIEYIEMNYSRKVSIGKISRSIGLDRSYFYSIFHEYMDSSPMNYLIRFRVDKACELMKNSILSIGDISRSVGYEDPLLFSKIFKKIKGIPPKEYRSKYLLEKEKA